MSTAALFVTGTGTDVGKTVVTAAVAALASRPVAVVKPIQTGTDEHDGDTAELARLVPGVDTFEFARYPEPLAPATAARRAGTPPPTPDSVSRRLAELSTEYSTVLVEGAGGVLVPFDEHGNTLLDVAARLSAPVLVVCSPGLGTLNVTALTVREVLRRGLHCPGTVFGSWPREPGTVENCNTTDLPWVTGVPLLGAVEEGAGACSREEFAARARHWLAPDLGGVRPVTAPPD